MISHEEAQELHRLIGGPIETNEAGWEPAAGTETVMVPLKDLERARELAAIVVSDTEYFGIGLDRDQLEAWAGRDLTDEQIETLEEAIPNSSIPDAIATIVEGME